MSHQFTNHDLRQMTDLIGEELENDWVGAPVRNQCNVCSCTAHCLGTMGRILLSSKRGKALGCVEDLGSAFSPYNLNIERLYNCRRTSDQGDYISSCFSYLETYGVDFKAKVEVVRKNCCKCLPHGTKIYKTNGFKKIYCSVRSLRDALEFSSVAFSIVANDAFRLSSYSPAKTYCGRPHGYTYDPKKDGVHSMLLVAYSPKRRAFFCQNSYGEDWGIKGFIWINEDALVDEIMYAARLMKHPVPEVGYPDSFEISTSTACSSCWCDPNFNMHKARDQDCCKILKRECMDCNGKYFNKFVKNPHPQVGREFKLPKPLKKHRDACHPYQSERGPRKVTLGAPAGSPISTHRESDGLNSARQRRPIDIQKSMQCFYGTMYNLTENEFFQPSRRWPCPVCSEYWGSIKLYSRRELLDHATAMKYNVQAHRDFIEVFRAPSFELPDMRLEDSTESISILYSVLENPLSSTKALNIKEQAITILCERLRQEKRSDEFLSLFGRLGRYFSVIPNGRKKRIVLSILDAAAKIPGSSDLQMSLCNNIVQWARAEKQFFLRLCVEARLAGLLIDVKKFSEAWRLLSRLGKEMRAVCRILMEVTEDEKYIVVEIEVLMSRLSYFIGNLPRAKSAFSVAIKTADSICVPPELQASVDLQNGILHAEEKKNNKAYNYFNGAFEAFNAIEDSRALSSLKYMLLCKIMTRQADDVEEIILSKAGPQYIGPELDAMKAVADAHRKRSLKLFETALRDYKPQLEEDPIIHRHLSSIYDAVLEKNLCKLIEPFLRVDICHVAELINLPVDHVEKKFSQMIMDRKLAGTLDQDAGRLIILDDPKSEAINWKLFLKL